MLKSPLYNSSDAHLYHTFWFRFIYAKNEIFRVEKFIGINMQKEIHFKTACLWLFFKLFHNM